MIDQQLDPLAGDAMARRLSRLAIDVPPAPRLVRRVTPGQTHQRIGRWRTPAALATAVAAALTLTVTASAYPGGLPALTAAALHAAGLTSLSDVSPVTGSGETGGIKVAVSGGYADRLSTLLFVSIDMPCAGPNCAVGLRDAPYLADQSGAHYRVIGGEGVGTGAYPIFFEPLQGSALTGGAKLTLHVPVYTAARGQGPSEVVVPIAGTLSTSSARSLSLPAPIADREQGVTYAVTGLFASGHYLEVHTRLSGRLDSVIQHYSGSAGTGETWPGVFLVGSDGSWQLPLAGSADRSDVTTELQDEVRIFSVRPGTYRIVVATSGDRNSRPGPGWATLASWKVKVS